MSKLTNSQVAHLWANNARPSAESSTGAFSFRDSTLYSYRTPIARLTERATLVTCERFSATTSTKHMPEISRALSGVHAANLFYVHDVTANTQDAHERNLVEMNDRANALDRKAKRARVNREWYTEQADKLRAECRLYAAIFLESAETLDIEKLSYNLAEREAHIQNDQIDRSKRQAIESAERDKEIIAEWRAGERATAYLGFRYPVMLRVSHAKTEIETSHGAKVEYNAARELFDAWASNLLRVGMHIGPFELRAIHDDRLVIGCHTIPRVEADALASAEGWND